MLFNELEFYTDTAKVDAAIADAKALFGENLPYVTEPRLGEDILIFSDHLISTSREAMTTGCMAKMNNSEEVVFNRFVDYQNGSSYRDITASDNEVMKALDKWLVDALRCIPHPIVGDCFDAVHTWKTC